MNSSMASTTTITPPVTSPYVPYPSLDDPTFNEKIARKQEFQEGQFSGIVAPIEARSKQLEGQPFELASHQVFVKTFLSFQTPYNSLLLYHGLGTGKTCSAIGIAEDMRHYLNKFQIYKRILVVASPNVQANFRKELFDENKLTQKQGEWVFEGCVGNSLLQEILPMRSSQLYPKAKLVQQIQLLIDKQYHFLGYIQFANMIERLASNLEAFKAEFNGRLVIIDEFHNMRTALAIRRLRTVEPSLPQPATDMSVDASSSSSFSSSLQEGEKQTTKQLDFLVDHADNLRLLLLSATPLYNSYQEIIWTLNLLHRNDKRPVISESEIFQANGDFQPAGREKLMAAARGYVSFVRGDNPYTFPFRIYPSAAAEHVDVVFPTLQLNGKPIEEGKQLSILTKQLTCVKIKKCQYDIYQKVLEHTFQKLQGFETLDGFKYTELQLPLQCLNIAYPISEEVMQSCREQEAVLDGGANGVEEYEGDDDDDENEDENEDEEESEEDDGQEAAAAILAEPVTEVETGLEMDANNVYVGTEGLQRVMRYQDTSTFKGDFEYNAPYVGFFELGNIGNFSCKIETICKKIEASKGVVLVYSQYLDGGLVPMALALEEMGLRRYGPQGKNLFKSPPAEYRNQSYVMITGDRRLSPNNSHEVRAASSIENRDGQVVKVILITMAGAEGLDLKFIRQVHVMDPWYNLNRIEQIVGRAVRNFSHQALPLEERNVEIFLYATLLRKDKANVETMDMYLYRKAEKKAISMGRITRVLKEGAVDCLLNYEQQHYTHRYLLEYAKSHGLDVQGIAFVRQRLSDGRVLEKFPVGDMPYSANCDFLESCEYACEGGVTPDMLTSQPTDNSTYDVTMLQQNIDPLLERIGELFRRSYIYTYKKLYKAITKDRRFDDTQVYYALSQMMDDRRVLHDRYGREGYLVNVGPYYLFQPKELANIHIDMFERSTPLLYKRKHFRVNPEAVGKHNPRAVQDETPPPFSTSTPVEKDHDLPREIQEIYQRIVSYYTVPTQKIPVQQHHSLSKYMGKAAAILTETLGLEKQEVLALALAAILDLFLYRQKVTLLQDYVHGFVGYPESLRPMLQTHVQSWLHRIGSEGKQVAMLYDYEPETQRVKLFPWLLPRTGRPEEATGGITEVREYDDLQAVQDVLRAVAGSEEREKIAYPLGFVSLEANGGTTFKIAGNASSSGASCFQKKHRDVVLLFQQLLPEEELQASFAPVYETANKDQLCVLLLLTLKYFNRRYPNRVWYLTLEAYQALFPPVDS